MTAADAHGTGEMPGEAAPENGNRGHDKTLRDADRMDKWSIAWTLTALLMWGVFAMLMLASDSPDASGSAGGRGCQGPLIAAFQERGAACEGGMRQWPVLLGVLVLALIPTIVAAATTVYARLLSRLATTLGETGGGTRSDGEKDHGTA